MRTFNGGGVILDHKGRRIVLEVSHPHVNPRRIARNKMITEAWLPSATKGDKDIGRGDINWGFSPEKALTQSRLDALRSKGIAVYVGPGQFIMADMNGRFPRIRQRRPLAERYIEIITEDFS